MSRTAPVPRTRRPILMCRLIPGPLCHGLSASAALTFMASVGALMGCDKQDEERGAPPPPMASSRPDLCASGGGTVTDKESAGFFARRIAGYCLDPNGETRAYGKEAEGSLDKVCTELFNGECEVYKSYGLERVVTLRYVDGGGTSGTVNINLSRFQSNTSAYGFFTKRVIADSDPIDSAPSELDAGGAGAIGTGIAYVWRGKYVGELSYTNEVETPEQIKTSSQKVLPALSRGLGDKLPGDREPPAEVQLLPTKDRVRLGVSLEPRDVFGVSGAGPGAIGYYQRGPERWRVLGIVRQEEAAAKDVVKTLGKLPGAKRLEHPMPAVRFPLRDDEASPPQQWVVSRLGARVVGIGDEPFGDPKATPTPERQLERLREFAAAIEAKPASRDVPASTGGAK